MKKPGAGIALLNHDIKNNIGVAITYMELLSLDYPELKNNEYIQATTEILRHANELSGKISLQCKSEEEEQRARDSGLVKLAVKEHAFKNVKPSYDHL